jgi:hypothetical protein
MQSTIILDFYIDVGCCMCFVIFKFVSFRILRSGIGATTFKFFFPFFSVFTKFGLFPGLQIFMPNSLSTNITYIICSQQIHNSLQICCCVIFASSFHYTLILRPSPPKKKRERERDRQTRGRL